MILTVNFVNQKIRPPKLMAFCNLTIDALQSDAEVIKAYEQALPHAMKNLKTKKKPFNAADIMIEAQALVNGKYPDLVLLNVDEYRSHLNPRASLNMNLV